MMQTGTIDVRKYLFILRRRWIQSVAVFIVVLAAGLAYCLFWPPVYEAVALVVVQPQKVPGGLVQSTVTTKMQERLQIITQQVLSRTRLMEIIERFNLYPEMRKSAAPDTLAERMRNDISIKISRQNYFTVSYTSKNPESAAAVANGLAAFFVDSNLRIREDDAVGTARFLARELERMQGQLKEWDNRITEFKEAHLHELPGQEAMNDAMLKHISNKIDLSTFKIFQLTSRVDSMDRDINKITIDIEHLKFRKAAALKHGEAVGGGDDAEGGSSTPEALRQRIESLLVRYTPDHPDVVTAYRLLAKAEAREAEEKAQRLKEAEEKGLSPEEAEKQAEGAEMELEIGGLREQLERSARKKEETKQLIEGVKADRAALERAAAEVRQRIENMPAVAERLGVLSRGYDVLEAAYNKMHAKWLEANVSANMERNQRGEQFDVVDPAEVPSSPSQPNIRKALPMALAVALALAVGLSFGLTYIDTSFTSVEQTERMSELPVLVVIPPLYTEEEQARRHRNLTFIMAVYGGVLLVLLAITALLLTGRGYMFKSLFNKVFG